MMYRCRILSLILSLAIIASFFCFQVSADSLPFFDIIWSYSDDGTSWNQLASSADNGMITLYANHYYWRIDGFRFYGGNSNQTEIFCNFSTSGITINDSNRIYLDASGYNGQKNGVVYTSLNSSNTSDRATYFVLGSTGIFPYDTLDLEERYNITGSGITFSIRILSNYSANGNWQTYFKLNVPPVFRIYSYDSNLNKVYQKFFPMLYNCNTIDSLNPLITTLGNSIISYLIPINNNVASILARLDTNYTYNRINFTSGSSSSTSGNVFDTIIGLLKNLSDHTEYNLQHAEDSGGHDAYEHSSGLSSIPGSFDFISGFSDSVSDQASYDHNSTWSSVWAAAHRWYSRDTLISIDFSYWDPDIDMDLEEPFRAPVNGSAIIDFLHPNIELTDDIIGGDDE